MKFTVQGRATIVIDEQVLLAPAVGVHLPPGGRWKVVECGRPPEVVYLIERPGLRLGYRPRGDAADVWVIYPPKPSQVASPEDPRRRRNE